MRGLFLPVRQVRDEVEEDSAKAVARLRPAIAKDEFPRRRAEVELDARAPGTRHGNSSRSELAAP